MSILPPPVCRRLRRIFPGLCVLLVEASASAAVRPYTWDASTLQLWHLNETAGAASAANAIPGGTPLNAIGNGATLGHAAFAGFGTAASTFDGGPAATVAGNAAGRDAYLGPLPVADGAADNLALAHDAADGAFTFEALVYVEFNPVTQATAPETARDMQIISADDETTRLMQFRLFWGSANDATPELQFINLGNVQTLAAVVPTSGANAIASGFWYHVAVTYSGAENTAGNLKFYWTKVEAGRTQADLLASLQMTTDLPNVSADWALGNELRATGGTTGNWVGRIDEVRLSSVARAAGGFLFFPDSEPDGLSDTWEQFYFSGSLAQTPGDDPDNDGFTNQQEYDAGSHPNSAASTPNDLDGDALPDAWEQQYFASLAQNGSGDPDGDTYSNAAELAAGTHPNSALSSPGDTDSDGLPDAWEQSFFGSLAQTGVGDADGDGASNLAEYQARSLPTNAASKPPGALAKFVPVDDGNAATSEYGNAGSSNINASAFNCSVLQTVGDKQFIAYYGRHETNASYAFNDRIWIGRRSVGAAQWEVFRTNFTANNINDGHDIISFTLDGEGVIHMSWGMHNDTFHYAKTTTPVTGSQPIVFGADLGTMTGQEAVVTYPQFLTLPNGDVLYFFRKGNPATGGSGSGDHALNRYSLATHTWTNVHTSGATQSPFIKGTGWNPDYNAYLNMPCVDAAGNLALTWTWRYTPDYQTNQDFAFAWSPDGGTTWRRSNNTTYTLPISKLAESGVENTRAEQILAIPQQSSLINMAGMCLDELGQPVIATWWAPGATTGDHRRQYQIVFPGGGASWEVRQVSERTIDAPGTKKDNNAVRDLGRPVVVCDREGRIIVIYRDNEGTNGLTVVHSLPRAQDPTRQIWTQFELTTANLGNYEPIIDLQRWQRDNVLHLLYQPSAGLGYTAPANNASPIGVLEWDAAAYFKARPELHLAFVNARADMALSFASQVGWDYRLWTSPDLITWTPLATFAGTGQLLPYTHPGGGGSGPRFWRLEVKEGGFAP